MKKRGREHSTLTETATEIIRELTKIPGIKMIAPGFIDPKSGKERRVTAVFTTAGFELSIAGQGVQKVAVHTKSAVNPYEVFDELSASKKLRHFTFHKRERKPGI